MEIVKFKCVIKWPWYTDRSRGNLKILVISPARADLTDLSVLDGVELDDFWEFNGGTDGDLEDFLKINRAGTKVIYKRRSTTSSFKRKAWLKLKDGKLYCFYKTHYGGRYAESFGVPNADTGGWLTKTVKINTRANEPGFSGDDEGYFLMEYKTKAGKKSIMRMATRGGQPRSPVDDAGGTGFSGE
jgi:hypothetical protein